MSQIIAEISWCEDRRKGIHIVCRAYGQKYNAENVDFYDDIKNNNITRYKLTIEEHNMPDKIMIFGKDT
jgi:hypothetical protein